MSAVILVRIVGKIRDVGYGTVERVIRRKLCAYVRAHGLAMELSRDSLVLLKLVILMLLYHHVDSLLSILEIKLIELLTVISFLLINFSHSL